MFRNLKAEMIRENISYSDIANAINRSVDTARLKINGKVKVNIDECKKIADLFDNKYTLEYLFDLTA